MMIGTNSRMDTRWCLFLRFLFRVLVVVGIFCLLVVGISGSDDGGTGTATSVGRLQHEDVIGRDETVEHARMDFNYMSKRRVPNGPDPIHNRRAGNSGRPPGQA